MGRGIEQDHVQAFHWAQQAAEEGHPLAQCFLGMRYKKGQGVERDLEKAIYWYTKAAEQGDSSAQCDLA